MKANVIARFWSMVDKSAGPNGCWKWLGWHDNDGYARFEVSGEGNLAHRHAYKLLVGPIPHGMELDHVRARGCLSRGCVNPAHLEPVSHRVNTLRGNTITALYLQREECLRGHPFDNDNTRIRIRGTCVIRVCRKCDALRQRESKERRKARMQP